MSSFYWLFLILIKISHFLVSAQHALRVLVENSVRTFLNFVETPCQCCLNVQNDFVWGYNLIDTQFKPLQPFFLLTLRMDENGAFYSTDPDLFEVSSNTLATLLSLNSTLLLLESAFETLRQCN